MPDEITKRKVKVVEVKIRHWPLKMAENEAEAVVPIQVGPQRQLAKDHLKLLPFLKRGLQVNQNIARKRKQMQFFVKKNSLINFR